MRVDVLAATQFEKPDDIDWDTDAYGGQALVEFAGRLCYQSWSKPNPETATNGSYIQHLLRVGHFSVLEHGTVTMLFREVSRSLTHELVRHRHFSFSQLSQRYADHSTTEAVLPPEIELNSDEYWICFNAVEEAKASYQAIVGGLDKKLSTTEPNKTLRRKRARQAARAVLPECTATQIVVTGNYRAWRHFIDLRATEAADIEICELAITCLYKLKEIAPSVFSDYYFRELEDGRIVAGTDFNRDRG